MHPVSRKGKGENGSSGVTEARSHAPIQASQIERNFRPVERGMTALCFSPRWGR